MPLRYYPEFYIVPDLQAGEGEFFEGEKEYSGKYYATINGRYFSGPNPDIGPSKELTPSAQYKENAYVPNRKFTFSAVPVLYDTEDTTFEDTQKSKNKPSFYYPNPTAEDYKKGYIIRYFAKKENERGFVIEISYNEYVDIINGTANYDISIYQTSKILWKLTGPLNSQRKSQYNIIPGIIDTNKRLTEETNKTFLGIIDFIGGDYAKFARPTP